MTSHQSCHTKTGWVYDTNLASYSSHIKKELQDDSTVAAYGGMFRDRKSKMNYPQGIHYIKYSLLIYSHCKSHWHTWLACRGQAEYQQ